MSGESAVTRSTFTASAITGEAASDGVPAEKPVLCLKAAGCVYGYGRVHALMSLGGECELSVGGWRSERQD